MTEAVGLPTLNDILSELAKPGRDPREPFESFAFIDGIEKIEDVKSGMKLPGIITNVTAFGVFVDIGVHQDGLVHISELSNRFIKNPNEVVKVHQKVMVTVLDVDVDRKRISLSMKGNSLPGCPNRMNQRAPWKNPKGKEKINLTLQEKTRSRFSNSPFAEALKNR